MCQGAGDVWATREGYGKTHIYTPGSAPFLTEEMISHDAKESGAKSVYWVGTEGVG